MSERIEAREIENSERDERVVHEVDGIQEYDNKLPNWWLYVLYGSVLFGIVYWFEYEVGGFGQSPLAAYETETERAAIARAANREVGEATPEALAALAKDPAALALGKQVFVATCAACHRQDGGGIVGPNLTDDFWLHGGAPERVYSTIAAGAPDKGMPAWQGQLGARKTQAVTAYVLQLRGTNVAGGKAPQGERETLTQR